MLYSSTSGPGIYHGTFNFQSTSDDFIDGARLFPYPARSVSPTVSHEPHQLEFPISMTLTEFHLVLLYSDRIVAISLLNENPVHEELLPLVRTWLVVIEEADFAS